MEKSLKELIAYKRLVEKKSWEEVLAEVRDCFPSDMPDLKIYRQLRYCIESPNKKVVCKSKETEKPKKIEVVQNMEPSVVNNAWAGSQKIVFALMGDTQINSKYTQLTHLHTFYDIVHQRGIKDVYHTGDIDEGEQMRIGHQYECYNQGADAHKEEIVRVYPQRGGVTTHFITGNHDASMIKRLGFDIGAAIAKDRSDMEYLGADCAKIMLTPNCSLELRHPWDGTAYAISYKTQRMIDSTAVEDRPTISATGHYHKAEYIFYQNVHCFQTGCFQAQTPFMKGKQIAAHMGGWIVSVEVGTNGEILSIQQEFIPFYKAIKDDYKNWSK